MLIVQLNRTGRVFSAVIICSYSLSLLHLEAIQFVLEKKREREREECTSSELLWVVVVVVVVVVFCFFFPLGCRF